MRQHPAEPDKEKLHIEQIHKKPLIVLLHKTTKKKRKLGGKKMNKRVHVLMTAGLSLVSIQAEHKLLLYAF